MIFTNWVELSLQMILPALFFIGVGAVTSQLLGTARGAKIRFPPTPFWLKLAPDLRGEERAGEFTVLG